MKSYLLDSNILIKVWSDYPDLLNKIDNSGVAEYKVTSQILNELANKEFEKSQGCPKNLFALVTHSVPDYFVGDSETKENRFIYEKDGQLYYTVGNKISHSDYSLIVACQNCPGMKLVTEDKRILKSAILVLTQDRVLNYDAFINDLRKLKII